MGEKNVEYVKDGFYPWRRCFARNLDIILNTMVLNFLITMVFHYNISRIKSVEHIVLQMAAVVLMLVFEPIYLHYFGTTFGKWVFGLALKNDTGEKLSLQQAFNRTKGVFIYGCFCGIPILDIYANWKCYNRYQNGANQPWEEEGMVYTIKDTKWYRGLAYILLIVLFIGVDLLLVRVGGLPPVRGDLTVSDFSRNYNYMDLYYNGKGSRYLDDEGAWETREAEDGVYFADFSISPVPVFEYKTENGNLKEVQFEIQLKNSKDLLDTYLNERLLASYAFSSMQDGTGAYYTYCKEVKKIILERYMEDFTFSRNGITCVNQIEYSGYEAGGDFFFPTVGKNNYFHMVFTMKKD